MPEYVLHIKRPHHDDWLSWCKKEKVGQSSHFATLDHAAAHALNEGRYLICEECAEEAAQTLRAWTYKPKEAS